MKRVLDLTLSAIALVLALPIFALTTIAILIFDSKPVLYKAIRAGKDGNPFLLYKFRTMSNSKNGDESRITTSNDSRVTKTGSILRKLKLDELPQLINIIKGDMSIIGPRPEDYSIVRNYYTEPLKETLKVKPGLSSPGTLYYYTHLEKELIEQSESKYLEDVMPNKLALDIYYIKNISLWYDIKLIARTIWVIILKSFGKQEFKKPVEFHEAHCE